MKRQIWKDSIEERRERYREILSKAPLLEVPCIQDSVPGAKTEVPCILLGTSEDAKDYVIDTIANYVTGPALYAYIDWVIRSAVEAGQKRLYFLARDGYLMYHAAKIYCEEKYIDMDCRYLYCSRYALRIPMYHLNQAETMEYICRNGIHITPVRVLRRSGMDAAFCRQLAKKYFPQWDPDQELNRQELSQLATQLKNNDGFWELCEAHSKKIYPEAETYLVQEGLLDDVPYALVDSGWIGSMQKTLGQLLKHIQGKEVSLHGYYWGLYDLPEGMDKDAYSAYYFGVSTGESEKIAFNNNLFEVLFSAPHGMTIGYQDGKPRFGKTDERQVALIQAVEPHLMQYIKDISGKTTQDRSRYHSIIRELFDCFMCHPTKEEAETFGSVSFSDDIFAETDQRLAEPVSEEALNSNHPMQKMLLASGIKHGTEHILAWYEGCAVLSGGNIDKHLKAWQTYKKLLTKKQERNWRNKS